MFYLEHIYEYLKRATGNYEDGSYDAIITENVQEASIERGHGFKVQMANTSLAGGATNTYLIRTPVDELITLGIETLISIDTSAFADALTVFSLYEDAVVTGIGNDTNVIVSNFNRNSADTNGFLIKNAPTVTNNGTLIMNTIAFSGAISTPNITFQLKADTDYIITINNPTGTACRYVLTNKIFQLPLQ